MYPNWPSVGVVMSNFDGQVREGAAMQLVGQQTIGEHSAYHFYGYVWHDGTHFVEEVWQYHAPIAIYKAETLKSLMEEVNDGQGWA